MDVVVWLRSLGLGKYEAVFRENDIDEAVLPSLTHETPKDLGVTSVGHRLKLLEAIAALRTEEMTKPPSADAAPSAHPKDRAERRHVTVMFSDLVGSTALSARMDPEDPPRGHFGLSEVRRQDRAALRRLRGEVHGRWGPGVFRLPAGP
jgi:class 3 adenylate cyclase